MEADDVLIGLAQLELLQNIVPHVARGAGGEGGDRGLREMLAQGAQVAVFGPELMAPFGDAVSFVDGEKSDGDVLQPADGVRPGEALGREVEQR